MFVLEQIPKAPVAASETLLERQPSMAKEINTPGVGSAARSGRQRTSEGGSLVFPAQTAKGDARLLEAVSTIASEQQTTMRKPPHVVVRIADKTNAADRPVAKSDRS